MDDVVDGPHLCRATTADGALWYGELTVEVDDDEGRIDAHIAWVDFDGGYETDVSDLFAASLRLGRSFRARHFNDVDDTWDLRVVQVD